MKILKLLINAGANLDIQDKDGSTALMLVIYKGNINTEIVKLLTDGGADLNLQDTDGWTALYAAVYDGNTEIVNLLINKGADKTLKTTKKFEVYPIGSAVCDIAKLKKKKEIITLVCTQ